MRRLVTGHSTNPLHWSVWLAIGIVALTAALLSSMMHLLRVWQGPRPLVDDEQDHQRAPLVDAAADVGPGPSGAAPASAPARPVWPPPSDRPLGLGSDLLATGRVAAAAQSGDYSQLSARDVAAAGRTATKAAAVWPPPQ